MKHKPVALLIAILIACPSLNLAQDGSWQQYNGNAFSFRCPGTWRVNAPVDRDATAYDLAHPLSVEFAVSPGEGGNSEKLSLNAQKHVLQFARMNNKVARFESATNLEGGAVRVLSHLCSLASNDDRFCAPNDPNVINVSSLIWATNGRIVLVEMMAQAGLGEPQINVVRKIAGTLQLRF
jgi:hypothetical protein